MIATVKSIFGVVDDIGRVGGQALGAAEKVNLFWIFIQYMWRAKCQNHKRENYLS